MADRRSTWVSTERRLDVALHQLAEQVSYPPTPDLAASVQRAIEQDATNSAPPVGWRHLRRGLALALIGLLVLVGAAAAVGIGLRGLSIVFVDSLPSGVGGQLDLGDRVSLADAEDRVGYDVLLPTGALREPDEVYLDDRRGLEHVTLVYVEDNVVQLLITQFRAETELTPAVKELGPGTSVEPVTVADGAGFWIEGDPHVLRYRDPRAEGIEDRTRLVGDVLVWQRGDLTLRIEGASRGDAIRIAESME